MHIPLNRISWKATLSDRIYIRYVFCLFEETLLHRQPFLIFPLACYLWDFELNTLTIVYSSSDQSKSSAKAQGPIYNFGLLSLQYIFLIYKLINVSFNLFFNFMILINLYIYIYIYKWFYDTRHQMHNLSNLAHQVNYFLPSQENYLRFLGLNQSCGIYMEPVRASY